MQTLAHTIFDYIISVHEGREVPNGHSYDWDKTLIETLAKEINYTIVTRSRVMNSLTLEDISFQLRPREKCMEVFGKHKQYSNLLNLYYREEA